MAKVDGTETLSIFTPTIDFISKYSYTDIIVTQCALKEETCCDKKHRY